jgi:hypothetical protein
MLEEKLKIKCPDESGRHIILYPIFTIIKIYMNFTIYKSAFILISITTILRHHPQ